LGQLYRSNFRLSFSAKIVANAFACDSLNRIMEEVSAYFFCAVTSVEALPGGATVSALQKNCGESKGYSRRIGTSSLAICSLPDSGYY
jgi:hypothetical protein